MNQDIDRYSQQGEHIARRPDGLLLTHLLYALYVAGWMTAGVSMLVAIITNYARRADVADTPCEAHFTWQIRTFWISVVGVLASIALLVYVCVAGWFAVLSSLPADAAPVSYGAWLARATGAVLAMGAAGVYVLYRLVKGWLYLYWNKPLEHPRGWI